MLRTYHIIKNAQNFSEKRLASWYSLEANSSSAALGEQFSPFALKAGHPRLSILSCVRITNLANGH